MYYKEEWINGKLCWKSTPDGEWIPFTIGQYKDRVLKLEAKLKNLSKANVSGNEAIPLEDLFLLIRTFCEGRVGDEDCRLLTEIIIKEINQNKKDGEVAVAFAEWIDRENYIVHNNYNKKYNWHKGEGKYYLTKQLYGMFLSAKATDR